MAFWTSWFEEEIELDRERDREQDRERGYICGNCGAKMGIDPIPDECSECGHSTAPY